MISGYNLPDDVTPEMIDEYMTEHIHCNNCEKEITDAKDELACIECRSPMCKSCQEYSIICESCLD